MKRKFVYFLSALLLTFAIGYFSTLKAGAVETEAKVVFHYQLWDQDYSSAGLWVWDCGTNGSNGAVTSDVTDSFGGVYTINVDTDAKDAIGVIALRKDISLDSRWDYRETPDGENFTLDVTKLKSGEQKEMHVYYFQGGYQTYFITDPTKVNIFVTYFDPTAGYEANLGLHSWGEWEQADLKSPAWGTPAKVFVDGCKSPANVKGKVALIQIDESKLSGAGFLVYAGDDASKKTAEDAVKGITDFADLKNGSVNLLYITGKNTYYGVDAVKNFADAAFKFDFIGFNAQEISGTYAVDPMTIFTKLTLSIATKEVVGKDTVTKTRIEKVPQLKEGSVPYVQTDKTFPAASLPELASGSIGRVVLHYQKWDGDYTGCGTWSWNRGDYTAATAMIGVDDFGAVIDLQISAAATDTIGFITINGGITADSADWPAAGVKASGDLTVDVTAIKNGTVTEIHAYYFEGIEGSSKLFVADPTKANIFVVYYDLTGNYEETLGVHSWGGWTNPELAKLEWGTPGNVFSDGFVSPKGVKGKVALLQAESLKDSGFLIYSGADDSKKTPNDASTGLANLADTAVGDVRVLYVALEKTYDGASKKGEFAEAAFSGEIEMVDKEVQYEEEVDVLDYIDFLKYFSLKYYETEAGKEEKVEKTVEIDKINFNKTAESTNEFVVVLKKALDPNIEYTLFFDNGKEGDEQNKAEIIVDKDTVKPVITLVSDEQVKIEQGKKWDSTLFPLYRVTDNRDSNLQNKVYVKPGCGTLNTNVAGDYPITLLVEDTYGNVGELTFNITVTPVETGCAAQNAAKLLSTISLAGILIFFFRRRRLA